jgi:predicted glutamine amidotransferase
LAAYLGHPILLSQIITEPRHSIIHQSYHAEERTVPLNGDGFGVAWYVPHVSERPALFKDVAPAWNSQNLLEIARVSSSHCVLAHVRAASPGNPVQQLNCHPFAHGRLSFMHNGGLAGFDAYRRRLLEGLSDTAFRAIRGSTDTEHAFAVFIDYQVRGVRTSVVADLADAMQDTLDHLEDLRISAGVAEPSYYNFVVSDGTCLVATRHGSPGGGDPASLYYTTGRDMHLENGHYQLDSDLDHNVVLVASERLNADPSWQPVPPGHMLLATHPGRVTLRPIRPYPAVPDPSPDPSGLLLPRR